MKKYGKFTKLQGAYIFENLAAKLKSIVYITFVTDSWDVEKMAPEPE